MMRSIKIHYKYFDFRLVCCCYLAKNAVHKYALHVDLLLPVNQTGTRILALSSCKASSLRSSLKVFNSEEIACSAIQSPV